MANIFNSDLDYANPIEPSHYGGDKLTNNIVDIILQNPKSYQVYSSTIYSPNLDEIDLTKAETQEVSSPSLKNEQFREM